MFGKLIITRHSLRYDDAAPELFGSNRNINVVLSNEGVDLCEKKGTELAMLVKDLDVIYVSPFVRVKQTGELLLKSYYENTYPFVEENHVEIKEMVLLAEGQNKFPPKFEADLIVKLETNGMGYPESSQNIAKRCKEVVDNIKKQMHEKPQNIMLVTHGIIYNHLLKYIYPNYRYNDTTNSGNYIPSCLDLTVLELHGDKFVPVFSDVENVKKLYEYSK
mgnify:CR=1 FL=1